MQHHTMPGTVFFSVFIVLEPELAIKLPKILVNNTDELPQYCYTTPIMSCAENFANVSFVLSDPEILYAFKLEIKTAIN